MTNRTLIILRGIPGSGKSHTARTLAPKENIFETDNFFIKDGTYTFDAAKISEAHTWNREQVEKAMQAGHTPLVCANTNITNWEIRPYRFLADKYNYEIEIRYPESPWFKEVHPRLKDGTFTEKDIQIFYEKNTHGVPYESIKKMMNRWEKYEEETT